MTSHGDSTNEEAHRSPDASSKESDHYSPIINLNSLSNNLWEQGWWHNDGENEAQQHSLNVERAFPSLCHLDYCPARPKEPHTRLHIHVRSLTLPNNMAFASSESIMSTSLDQSSPGSPPELTNSKSSKSSSFHSSSFADAGPNDIAHFEDISLDDMRNAFSQECYHTDSPKSMSPVTMPTSAPPVHRINTGSSLRDITNKYTFNPNDHQAVPLGLPPQRPRKRRPKSPSTFLPSLIAAKRSRSISPTSPKSNSYTSSPRSASSQGRPATSAGPFGRRQSWQPGRKTVKELEDEIHDSDEELPEDAVIWNVPISPRPPHERDASRSPKRPDSGEISPGTSDKGLGIQVSRMKSRSRSPKVLPTSPHTGILSRSVSMASIPENYSLTPRSGPKSWDSAMLELSDEARELTQVLETFAEEKEREQEEKVQSRSPRTNTSAQKRSITMSSIELPPMRKGDIMIDPLPISKEKEKVLTRTRPSWLPPKNPEEEKRHLKEYQKMMAKALEAEKKKAKRQQQQQCERDMTKESLAKVWEQHVLPNWDTVISEPRTRELWWRGITSRDRGTVWQKAAGNELGLSEAGYTLALQRARAAEKRILQLSPEERVKESEWLWFEAIRRDVSEAFPELKIFQPGGPLHESLLDVLMAYVMYRSDVGYVHGTHHIAALLILNLSTPTSFITLANILNRPTPSSVFTSSPSLKSNVYDLVLQALSIKIPNLHTHLTNPTLELKPSNYLDPIFTSLFCSSKFGMDIASRIWDVYVFEGDQTLVEAAVATLGKLEGRLYGSKAEVLEVLSKEHWDLGSDDDFMNLVRDMVMMEESKT